MSQILATGYRLPLCKHLGISESLGACVLYFFDEQVCRCTLGWRGRRLFWHFQLIQRGHIESLRASQQS